MIILFSILIPILLIFSGFAKAVMDLSEEGKIKFKPSRYWIKSMSSPNKWKDGDPRKGEKFFGSSRWFVSLTDAGKAGVLFRGNNTSLGNGTGAIIDGISATGTGLELRGNSGSLTPDIMIIPNNGRLYFDLNTDNTVTEVMGKDFNGYAVWKDLNSMPNGIYTGSGTLSQPTNVDMANNQLSFSEGLVSIINGASIDVLITEK